MTNPEPAAWANALLLIPTQLELDCFWQALREYPSTHQGMTESGDSSPKLCGFGPIAAGIETSRFLCSRKYQRVLLLGIAGTYDPLRLPVGTACSFRSCGVYGIGAGTESKTKTGWDIGFQTNRELGFPQTQIDGKDCFDELPLEPLAHSTERTTAERLLTVCIAAGNQDEVAARRNKFPTAMAEDMEAFAVALAAARHGIPTTVIRGISNVAGDRQVTNWRITDAMNAAVQLMSAGLPQAG